MAPDDAHLAMLIDNANAAELHHFALGISTGLKCTESGDAPSTPERQAIEQALIDLKTAQQALDTYKAVERWATNRD